MGGLLVNLGLFLKNSVFEVVLGKCRVLMSCPGLGSFYHRHRWSGCEQ